MMAFGIPSITSKYFRPLKRPLKTPNSITSPGRHWKKEVWLLRSWIFEVHGMKWLE